MSKEVTAIGILLEERTLVSSMRETGSHQTSVTNIYKTKSGNTYATMDFVSAPGIQFLNEKV